MDGITTEHEALAWRAIQEPSFQGILHVRPDLTIAGANSQLYEILGTSPAEMQNRAWLDFVHHPFRQKERVNTEIAAQTGSPYQAQLTIEKENGELVHILLIGKAVKAEGELVLHIKEVMEYTPSKQAGKAPMSQILAEYKAVILTLLAIAAGVLAWLGKALPLWARQ